MEVYESLKCVSDQAIQTDCKREKYKVESNVLSLSSRAPKEYAASKKK